MRGVTQDIAQCTNNKVIQNMMDSKILPRFDTAAMKTCYIIFGIILALTYIVSDEPFSLDHNYCIGPLFQAFAFVLLGLNLATTRSAAGVSSHMLCFLISAYAARLLPSIFLLGYMPVGTGDRIVWYISESTATGLCAYIFYEVTRGKYVSTRDTDNDKFPFLPVLAACMVLAAATKSDANMVWVADWLWMFSQYLECVAIVPQLLLVSRQGTVQKVVSHFMMNLIISRVVYGVFWLTVKMSYEGLPVFFQIGVAILNLSHTVFCGDFVYYFVKSINQEQMVLPSN